MSIDNYPILNTGSDGAISPIGRIMQEVIGLVRANNLEGIFRGASRDENEEPSDEA